MKKILEKIQNEKGATLIELLVAVIIFSTVMIAVIGILISAIKADKRIAAKQENIDSARYSMEFMIKELRMAKENAIPDLTFNNDTGSKLANGVFNSITFTNSVNVSVTYSLSGCKIRRNGQPISSDNIDVTALKFWINDWDLTQDSGTAPLITIYMEMKGITGIAAQEIVNLQSSVSPRIY